MKKRRVILFAAFLFLLLCLIRPSSVLGQNYVCVDRGECIHESGSGGGCVSNTLCSEDCDGSAGECCCYFSEGGFKNWTHIIWGQQGTPSEFRILGIDMEASQLKSLIKTFVIVGISGLVVSLVGVSGYGAFLWITAGDKEEQLQKAKKVMMGGLVGLLITFGGLIALGVMAGIMGLDITDFSFLDEILG